MNKQAVAITTLSVDEYLEGELYSEIRHEYYDGDVYAMAGAGVQHNTISLNIASVLRQKTRGTDCRVFMADMKLHIAELNRFYYPDILLACDPDDNEEYFREHPCLIVEVLSPSTENIDRGEKFHTYQRIPSLKEYLMVSQDKMQLELYQRNKNSWQYFLLDNEKDVLNLSCLDIEMTLPEIYEDVVFSPKESDQLKRNRGQSQCQ